MSRRSGILASSRIFVMFVFSPTSAPVTVAGARLASVGARGEGGAPGAGVAGCATQAQAVADSEIARVRAAGRARAVESARRWVPEGVAAPKAARVARMVKAAPWRAPRQRPASARWEEQVQPSQAPPLALPESRKAD